LASAQRARPANQLFLKGKRGNGRVRSLGDLAQEAGAGVLPGDGGRDVPHLPELVVTHADHRDQPAWTNWEDNVKYLYAIEHDGRRYPVKMIVSLAAQVERTSFSGGRPANSYVEARGFTVIELREGPSRSSVLALFRGIQTWKDGETIAVHKPLLVLYALARYQAEADRLLPSNL